VLLVNSFLSP
jgi:hypothetical protein